MSPRTCSPSQWTTWWKTAKALIEQDDRFDLSQAFRQTYRIRTASDGDELALPVIVPRRGVRPNLNLIRRFLDQHPDETGRAARVYTSILQRWARQDKTTAEEKMAIGLQLHRWQRRVDEDFIEALAGVLDGNYEASTFAEPRRPDAVGHGGAGAYEAVAGRPPASPFPRATTKSGSWPWSGCRSEPDSARGLLAELIEQPNDRPVAALPVIASRPSGQPARAVRPGGVGCGLWGCGSDRDDDPRADPQAGARRAGIQIDTHRALAEDDTGGDTDRPRLNLIRRWRTSERFLQPLENIMRAAGFDQLLRDLRTERMARTNQMLLSHAEQDTLILPPEMMTRATFEKLKREIQRLDNELHTTLAQTIARARVPSATSVKTPSSTRPRQSNATTRRASRAWVCGWNEPRSSRSTTHRMAGRRQGPRSVEEPSSGAACTYWILGEGDDYHGPEVLSYAAPLGARSWVRRVGDKVKVPTRGRDPGVLRAVDSAAVARDAIRGGWAWRSTRDRPSRE